MRRLLGRSPGLSTSPGSLKVYQPCGEIHGNRALKPTAVLTVRSTGSAPLLNTSKGRGGPSSSGQLLRSIWLSTICMPVSTLVMLMASAGVAPFAQAAASAPHRLKNEPSR